ncbi:IS200/IS605 family transposase, partial [Paramaledivibacter caminithermalis]
MVEYRRSSHTIYDIKYHVIWVTKYRYKMLRGKIAERLRDLIRQGCEARKITIVQGSVGKDHVHLLISCPTDIAPSKIVQYLKG